MSAVPSASSKHYPDFLRAARELGLHIDGPLDGVREPNVIAASSKDRDVVLKCPRGSDDVRGEAQAMAILYSRGLAPRSELCAEVLVIDRVRPGTPMSVLWKAAPKADVTKHLEVAGTLLASMAGLGTGRLTLTVDALLRRDVARSLGPTGEVTTSVLAPATVLATLADLDALAPLAGAPSLCHGDFHPGNILLAGTNWVVIDPRAVVGDPCADVGRMAVSLALGLGWDLEESVTTLSSAARLSPARAVVWARAWLLQTLGHHWRYVEQDGPLIHRYVELLTRG